MKNYLIIGGSSGIGKSLVELLSKENRVYATYRNNKQEDTGKITYHHFDTQTQGDWSFLPDTLDGIAYLPGGINLVPFARIKKDNFLTDFNNQVTSAITSIQAALPALKASEQASILLFSTVAVQTGFNFHAQVSTIKGALEGLTKALAAEFAPKIRVNAIAPSITNTPLAEKLLNTEQKVQANAQRHPLKKVASPEDVAKMGAFLLSDQASFITGQVIGVDGGISSLKV